MIYTVAGLPPADNRREWLLLPFAPICFLSLSTCNASVGYFSFAFAIALVMLLPLRIQRMTSRSCFCSSGVRSPMISSARPV